MPPARRIVSLTPSNTEVLWALDALDRLVGADDHSDFPADLDVPRVGPDLQVDVDAVAALEPDLVLASLSVPGMERIVDEVKARGLPSMVLAPKSLDDVLADHVTVGHALGLEDQAAQVVANLRKRVEAVRRATEGVERPRVFWEWWPKPLISAGAGSWMTEVIAIAGGVNVCADRPQESPQLQPDDVPALSPDVVGACWCGSLQQVLRTAAERVAARPGWIVDVWPLDEGLFGRPGPRLVEGLELLAWLLHRDLVDAPKLSGSVQGVVPRGGRATTVFHPEVQA